MGKANGERRIVDECRLLVEHLETHLNWPVDVGPLMSPAVNNIVCQLLFGRRYEYADAHALDRMKELDRLMVSLVPAWKPFIYSPKLLKLPLDIFGYKEAVRRLQAFYAFIQEQIDEHKTRLPTDAREEDFIYTFLAEREQQLSQGQTSTTFTGIDFSFVFHL